MSTRLLSLSPALSALSVFCVPGRLSPKYPRQQPSFPWHRALRARAHCSWPTFKQDVSTRINPNQWPKPSLLGALARRAEEEGPGREQPALCCLQPQV